MARVVAEPRARGADGASAKVVATLSRPRGRGRDRRGRGACDRRRRPARAAPARASRRSAAAARRRGARTLPLSIQACLRQALRRDQRFELVGVADPARPAARTAAAGRRRRRRTASCAERAEQAGQAAAVVDRDRPGAGAPPGSWPISRLSTAFGPTSRKTRAPSAYIASISATNSTGRTRCSAICLRVLRDVGRVRAGRWCSSRPEHRTGCHGVASISAASSRCAGLTSAEWKAAATGSSATSMPALAQLRRRRRARRRASRRRCFAAARCGWR